MTSTTWTDGFDITCPRCQRCEIGCRDVGAWAAAHRCAEDGGDDRESDEPPADVLRLVHRCRGCGYSIPTAGLCIGCTLEAA